MKTIPTILSAIALSLLLGCASHPVAVTPVGPNPQRQASQSPNGQLDVYSALRAHSEGDDPPWLQPTDYYIFDQQGRTVKHVANSVGRYDSASRMVTLPPGKYVLKARAKDFLWVGAPVVIEAGRTTRVHLDAAWQPPANTPPSEFVSLPDGYRVGWSTNSEK